VVILLISISFLSRDFFLRSGVTRAVLNCVGKILEISDRLTSFVIEGNKISILCLTSSVDMVVKGAMDGGIISGFTLLNAFLDKSF
jgi:hypothetical protein